MQLVILNKDLKFVQLLLPFYKITIKSRAYELTCCCLNLSVSSLTRRKVCIKNLKANSIYYILKMR